MQRMDEALRASSKTGGGPILQVLPSITVLAEADETELEALEDWARGLDWVHWLFSGVRQRLSHLHFSPEPAITARRAALPSATASAHAASVFRSHPSPLLAAWENFTQGQVSSSLGPLLIRAWQAAHEGDAKALAALDHELNASLPAGQMELSLKAGSQLLRNTHRARYQGVLHHYRTLQDEGKTPGHFLVVWSAVGQFFQLSVANVIAEYLRLEWTMTAREFGYANEPDGLHSIVKITSRLMKNSSSRLKLMGEPEAERGRNDDAGAGDDDNGKESLIAAKQS